MILYRHERLYRATSQSFRYGCFLVFCGTSVARNVRNARIRVTSFTHLFHAILARRGTLLQIGVGHETVMFFASLTTSRLQRGTTLTRNTRLGRDLSRVRINFALTSRVRTIRRRTRFLNDFLPHEEGYHHRLNGVRNGTRPLSNKKGTIGCITRFHFPSNMRVPT